jgi:hypothetical protein
MENNWLGYQYSLWTHWYHQMEESQNHKGVFPTVHGASSATSVLFYNEEKAKQVVDGTRRP